jgi:hypothetical protein
MLIFQILNGLLEMDLIALVMSLIITFVMEILRLRIGYTKIGLNLMKVVFVMRSVKDI